MLQIISFIIFIISGVVIFFIIRKKIPLLVQLPENGHHGIKKPEFFLQIERKIKDFYFNFFKKQIFLQKTLLWVKLLVLKVEVKVDYLLHGIRKNAQELEKQAKVKQKRTRDRTPL